MINILVLAQAAPLQFQRIAAPPNQLPLVEAFVFPEQVHHSTAHTHCPLPTSHFAHTMLIPHCPHLIALLIPHCPQPIAHTPLPTSHCIAHTPLPTTHCSYSTAHISSHCSYPTARHWPHPIAHTPLLDTAHIPLLIPHCPCTPPPLHSQYTSNMTDCAKWSIGKGECTRCNMCNNNIGPYFLNPMKPDQKMKAVRKSARQAHREFGGPHRLPAPSEQKHAQEAAVRPGLCCARCNHNPNPNPNPNPTPTTNPSRMHTRASRPHGRGNNALSISALLRKSCASAMIHPTASSHQRGQQCRRLATRCELRVAC